MAEDKPSDQSEEEHEKILGNRGQWCRLARGESYRLTRPSATAYLVSSAVE